MVEHDTAARGPAKNAVGPASAPEPSAVGVAAASAAPGVGPAPAAVGDKPAMGAPSFPGQLSGGGLFTAGKPEARKLFFWFFLGMLLFSLYLLYYVMQPFVDSIILACVFTAISYPLYQRCLNLTGGRRIPAATIVLCSIALLLIILISVFMAGLIPQARNSITGINQWLGGGHLGDVLSTYLEPWLLWLQEHFPEFQISILDIRDELTSLSTKAGQYLLGSATAIVGNTLLVIAHMLLILLIMFFLFIDGSALVNRLSYLFPMKPEQTAVVIESLRRMSRAVLIGGFSVAVLQGIAGGIGFAIVGIPALFWGLVMAFAALVPVVGTGLIWVPAVGYLIIAGRWESALFLSLWCGIGVTSIDSLLRPFLMRGGAKVPLLFLFMAILGGVNVFGMLGLLYGPMILGLVAVMLDIYAEEYHDVLQNRSRKKTESGKA